MNSKKAERENNLGRVMHPAFLTAALLVLTVSYALADTADVSGDKRYISGHIFAGDAGSHRQKLGRHRYFLTEAASDGGLIDRMNDAQYASQDLNCRIWPMIKMIPNPDFDITAVVRGEISIDEMPPAGIPDESATYDGEIAAMKRWIQNRIEWVYQNIGAIRQQSEYELIKAAYGIE